LTQKKIKMVIAWFSAGITSAVACKLAIEEYKNVNVVYIDIKTSNQDNERFISDCQKWYGQEITRIKSEKYADQFEVIKDKQFINSPFGAPCTNELKKKVRIDFCKDLNFEAQVFGYEFELKQINRAIRFEEQYPYTKPVFPLIDKKLNKKECAGILQMQGIELPKMYKLGFPNNNCIGCVKGGKGYWNLVRQHFPEVFEKMAKTEREIGASCINGTFLDELKEDEGNLPKEVLPECGIFCSVEFEHLISPKALEKAGNID